MRERILKFIESEGITAAEFADKIGVQRSSVSHVLNGRNNPGFAFIQKILEAYPSINSRWLLTGSEQMKNIATSEIKANRKETDLFSTIDNTTIKGKPEIKSDDSRVNILDRSDSHNKENTQQSTNLNERKVIKVLIFYDDHTFEDFRPAK